MITTSDWDRLFAECATSADFRANLAAALEANDEHQVNDLLTQVGASGHDATARQVRLNALRFLRATMFETASEFGAEVSVAP
jgi:hypothetical protein